VRGKSVLYTSYTPILADDAFGETPRGYPYSSDNIVGSYDPLYEADRSKRDEYIVNVLYDVAVSILDKALKTNYIGALKTANDVREYLIDIQTPSDVVENKRNGLKLGPNPRVI
jgi:hypothetical protein